MISNIDSIFFSVDFKDYQKENQELISYLEEYKQYANQDKMINTIIELKEKKFTIMPNGARFHAYILHNDSFEIKIAQARSNSKNNYPVSIRIKSLLLWEKGFLDAYIYTMNYIKKLFKGEILADKISRADLCCHTDKLTFDTLEDLSENWRGNFRKVQHFYYNRKLNALYFGSFEDKKVMCRIYDKSLEIKTSQKTWFNDIWEKNNLDINKVWNVEFQVGRGYFKEYNIESVQDFILQMRSIWEFLTTKWISYIIQDDTNISRCSTKTVWKQLQQVFIDYCKIDLIKREKQLNRNAERLIPLLTGVLTSYGACKEKIVLDKVIDDFKKDLDKYLKDKKGNVPVEKMFYEKLVYINS